jgi:hypothetical protein
MSMRRQNQGGHAPAMHGMVDLRPQSGTASRLAHVLNTGHQQRGATIAGTFDLSDMATAVQPQQIRAGFEAPDQLEPSMHVPDGCNEAEISAWYDGVVDAAKKGAKMAKEAAKKGVKMAKDNATRPRMIKDGKMEIPSAIHDLYTRTLAYPQDDDGERFIVNGFIPEFDMKKGYTGKKLTKHAEYIDEVKALGKKYGAKIKIDITHIFESLAGDWIPGGLKGMKLYTVVSQVSAKGLPEDTMIDIIFLMRDTKDNGDWKIKKIIHDGTFDA